MEGLLKAIGVEIDEALLRQALTHSSYANETGEPSNERLEFLGDAVVNLIVAKLLYGEYPDRDEGFLSKVKHFAVDAKTLAELARRWGIEKYIRLGKGEERSGGREKENILADAAEAIIGAVFLTHGFEKAEEIVRDFFVGRIREVPKELDLLDSKGKLQEYVQRAFGVIPDYKVLSVEGPDHRPKYTVGVFIEDTLYGVGVGGNKKSAERRAAFEALKRLKKEGRV